MRALHLALVTVAMIGPLPAFAQMATGPVAGATPVASPTLNERIDGAAGLNSTRSPHDSGPLAVPLRRGAAVASPTTRALEKAGSPSGTPLGTGAVGKPVDTDPPTPAAARGDDPRNPN